MSDIRKIIETLDTLNSTVLSESASAGASSAGGFAPVESAGFQNTTMQRRVPEKKKGKYSNSVSSIRESSNEPVTEDELAENDLIVMPGQSRNKHGFISKDEDRTDQEVEMALADLLQAGRNAKKIFDILQNVSEEEGIEAWVQEKLIKAADYLDIVCEYLEGKQDLGNAKDMGHTDDDLDALQGEFDSMYEGKKVDRMVGHIKQSEKELGHSSDEAEDIAWATANKRGMLNNRNKKGK